MADVSEITVNSTTYNLKDSVARDHISNHSNPHNVTKAQIGLGNVSNIDQSKAIKSITRSGTTFTATALDGTTSTFTQQDNNTTYGVATENTNGLLSAADKKAIDREFFRMLPKGGTRVPSGADINSVEYLKIGNYYNSLDAESKNIKNLPTSQAFMMFVLSPLSEVYDNESTAPWVYRTRIYVSYRGDSIYTQSVSSGTTAGTFYYGSWLKLTTAKDISPINSHISNTSNPHSVTKSQIGLGSVSNYDQSKAIKSITRSGTTFTYTALDGSTGTFTQQDYGTGTATSSGITKLYTGTGSATDGTMTQAAITSALNGKLSTSGNAASATKATQDSSGQQINSTYIKSLSISGRTITFTRGDNTTGTLTTQDTNTTYNVATSSANGLMSSSDKSKLDGLEAASVSGTTLVFNGLEAASVSGTTLVL